VRILNYSHNSWVATNSNNSGFRILEVDYAAEIYINYLYRANTSKTVV
jgi:hypothetical protein